MHMKGMSPLNIEMTPLDICGSSCIHVPVINHVRSLALVVVGSHVLCTAFSIADSSSRCHSNKEASWQKCLCKEENSLEISRAISCHCVQCKHGSVPHSPCNQAIHKSGFKPQQLWLTSGELQHAIPQILVFSNRRISSVRSVRIPPYVENKWAVY